MALAVALRDVTRRYQKGEHVLTPLAGVTLEVAAGEFFVLLGPSGSGKTTLLNLIAGIDRPDAGTVTVAGQELGVLGERQLARWRAEHVGYVFQQANLVPVLSAWENVELPLLLFRLTAAERARRVALALTAVGLTEHAAHLPRQLSGGQEQRVAIARAIVADPAVVVADEPTGSLDHEAAEGVLTLLQRLQRELGKTVVMVTHDRRAAAFGSRRMSLDKGQLSPEGAAP
jgi:putative ABC transport system ATP-binding protein